MFDIEKLNVQDDIWSEIENSKRTFEKELYKEINKGHILYGVKVKDNSSFPRTKIYDNLVDLINAQSY
jgi:hypothetical protein